MHTVAAVVDQGALAAALRDGVIAAAGDFAQPVAVSNAQFKMQNANSRWRLQTTRCLHCEVRILNCGIT